MQRDEAKKWLQTANASDEYFRLLSLSNGRSRAAFEGRAYVFAQIGINADLCSKNCKFCSMASSHYSLNSRWSKDTDTILSEVAELLKHEVSDLFLMTTADFPIRKYLEIGGAVKRILPESTRLVANVGDFDMSTAYELKSVGFTGAYHIKRLREGIDTMILPSDRVQTIENIVKAGLELYYCIEPIGPEHSYDEILDEIYFATQYPIEAMAVMRRTPVQGTPLCDLGQINAMELTKIAAVTNLVIRPARSMNVHEPSQMSLLAGINQLYAESGANPRDVISETESNRGFTPDAAWAMLAEAGY